MSMDKLKLQNCHDLPVNFKFLADMFRSEPQYSRSLNISLQRPAKPTPLFLAFTQF